MKPTMKTSIVRFDDEKLLRKMDAARRRNLSKAGYIIMRSARKKIADKASPSLPGEPPRDVSGKLKHGILFGYDRESESVVVGPEIKAARRASGGVPVPAVLEHGGMTKRKDGPVFSLAPRPFMAPSLEKHADKIAPIWRNSIQ